MYPDPPALASVRMLKACVVFRNKRHGGINLAADAVGSRRDNFMPPTLPISGTYLHKVPISDLGPQILLQLCSAAHA
jgi:hypothetical protein